MNFEKTNVEKAQDTAVAYGNKFANGVENAVDSAHDVAKDALSSASSKVDSLRDQAKPAVERVVARGQELAKNAIAGTREAGVRAKKAVSGYADACESYVSEQPMKSIAIAAAAGATVAALVLLSRSRSHRARYDR